MPISKITSDRNQANLPQDLERYCQYALKRGADEARVVDASKIVIVIGAKPCFVIKNYP